MKGGRSWRELSEDEEDEIGIGIGIGIEMMEEEEEKRTSANEGSCVVSRRYNQKHELG